MALTWEPAPARGASLQDVPAFDVPPPASSRPAAAPAAKRRPASTGANSVRRANGGGSSPAVWIFGLETGAELYSLAGVQAHVEDAGAFPPVGFAWGLSATRTIGSRGLVRAGVRAGLLSSRKLDTNTAPQILSERREGELTVGMRVAGAPFGGNADGLRGLLWVGAGYGWISRLRAQNDYGDVLEIEPGGTPHGVLGVEALWVSERRGVGASFFAAYRYRGALQVTGFAAPVSLSQLAAGVQLSWVMP